MKPTILSMYDDTVYGKESNLKFEKTLTQQQFAEEQDVNNIIRKYGASAFIDPTQIIQHNYADVSKAVSFQDAKNIILEADNAFMQLPAEIRREFDNDPSELVQFLADPKNKEKALKLGLIDLKEQKIPVKESAQAPQADIKQ